MKAILEFNLPEDQAEHQKALNGWKWAAACLDMNEHLRAALKYETLTKEHRKTLEGVREALFEVLRERGLSFDD